MAFVDALVRNRRPPAFRASVEDGEIMRAAIELRSARVEEMTPSPEFVDGLHDELRRQLAGDLPVEMPTISRTSYRAFCYRMRINAPWRPTTSQPPFA